MDPPIPAEPTINGGKETGALGEFGVTGPDPKEVVKARLSAFEVGPVLNDMNNLFQGDWVCIIFCLRIILFLTHCKQFYFAGAGEFYFKNPVFNREADLLLELQYKGV